MDRWREAGHTTVFMAGAFDLPTPNHRLGLAEARLMAGSIACGLDYATLNETTPDRTMAEVRRVAASDIVKLMVTLDTDEAVANAKAYRPDKGDCIKPLLGWGTRAHNLASYTAPRSDGTNHSMVDYITSHGPKACLFCHDCLSNNNAFMVPRLVPDLVVINGASRETLEIVVDQKDKGRLPGTAIGITNEREHQYIDRLLGGRVSGTSIVRRARGMPPE